MPNKQSRQSWPFLEQISPKAAALLKEDINEEAFNIKWMLEEETLRQDSGGAAPKSDQR